MSVHWGGKGLVHVSRWSPIILGTPSIDLNFAAIPVLDSRLTFARSSVATTVDSSGVMQTAAINAPRFDTDPVTLQSRGLLVEEASSNVLLNSLLSGVNLLTQSVTVSAVVYTLSFYGTGTITLTGAHSATVVGTGAYPARRTLTFTPSIGALLLTVSGTVQFAQLEVGSFATSFIPTTGIIASRSADIVTMTGTNFSSWYNQAEGTMLCDFTLAGVTTGGSTSDVWAVDNSGSATNSIRLRQGVSISGTDALMTTGGVTQVDTASVATSANTRMRTAFAWSGASSNLTTNGVSLSDGGAITPPTVNQLVLTGSNKWIRRLAFYKKRLINSQLRSLTSA